MNARQQVGSAVANRALALLLCALFLGCAQASINRTNHTTTVTTETASLTQRVSLSSRSLSARSASWSSTVPPTRTPTGTVSSSRTRVATSTVSATVSATLTSSRSSSNIPTPSASATASVSASASATAAKTRTGSFSGTVSLSLPPTATGTSSATITNSASASASLLPTPTQTHSRTASAETATETHSLSRSAGTRSVSLSRTSRTVSVAVTYTPSFSMSMSVSWRTPSVSASASRSQLPTPTFSVTPSMSYSSTASGSLTLSNTLPSTSTLTLTRSASHSLSASGVTFSVSATLTQTVSNSATWSISPEPTTTTSASTTTSVSGTASLTRALTPSASGTASFTTSVTDTASRSSSSSLSASATWPTGTRSMTASRSLSLQPTATATLTQTASTSQSPSGSGSQSLSRGTPSSSLSETSLSRTITESVSASASSSSSSSPTLTAPTGTGTPSVTASVSLPPTPTRTATQTWTFSQSGSVGTPSATWSSSITATRSDTATVSASVTLSRSVTTSTSGSTSASGSTTRSLSVSVPTPSASSSISFATETVSMSGTRSPTESETGSRETLSASASMTTSRTLTASRSFATPSSTPSQSLTGSTSASLSRSNSLTGTASATATRTGSVSPSASLTQSGSASASASTTVTLTASVTPSSSPSGTVTQSGSLSESGSRTITMTRTGQTESASPSVSTTQTFSASPSLSASASSSLSTSRSESSSGTASTTRTGRTDSTTLSPSRSVSDSRSISHSATHSSSVSASRSASTSTSLTATRSGATVSTTPSDSYTASRSFSASASSSASGVTASLTPSGRTVSATITGTMSGRTDSSSLSPSATASPSGSGTGTATRSGESVSLTVSPSRSWPTSSLSASATHTRSAGTPSASWTPTGTPPITPTLTLSWTRSLSQTPSWPTLSLSASATASVSGVSPTWTGSLSLPPTPSDTISKTQTTSPSASATESPTATPSANTHSPTATGSRSGATASGSPSVSASASMHAPTVLMPAADVLDRFGHSYGVQRSLRYFTGAEQQQAVFAWRLSESRADVVVRVLGLAPALDLSISIADDSSDENQNEELCRSFYSAPSLTTDGPRSSRLGCGVWGECERRASKSPAHGPHTVFVRFADNISQPTAVVTCTGADRVVTPTAFLEVLLSPAPVDAPVLRRATLSAPSPATAPSGRVTLRTTRSSELQELRESETVLASNVSDLTVSQPSATCVVTDASAFVAVRGRGTGPKITCTVPRTRTDSSTSCVTSADFQNACGRLAECAGYTVSQRVSDGTLADFGHTLHATATVQHIASEDSEGFVFFEKSPPKLRSCSSLAAVDGNVSVYVSQAAMRFSAVQVFVSRVGETSTELLLEAECGGSRPFADGLAGAEGECATLALCYTAVSVPAGSVVTAVVSPPAVPVALCSVSAKVLTILVPVEEPRLGSDPVAPAHLGADAEVRVLLPLPRFASESVRVFVFNTAFVALLAPQSVYAEEAVAGQSSLQALTATNFDPNWVAMLPNHVDNTVVRTWVPPAAGSVRCGSPGSQVTFWGDAVGRSGQCGVALACPVVGSQHAYWPMSGANVTTSVVFAGFVDLTVTAAAIAVRNPFTAAGTCKRAQLTLALRSRAEGATAAVIDSAPRPGVAFVPNTQGIVDPVLLHVSLTAGQVTPIAGFTAQSVLGTSLAGATLTPLLEHEIGQGSAGESRFGTLHALSGATAAATAAAAAVVDAMPLSSLPPGRSDAVDILLAHRSSLSSGATFGCFVTALAFGTPFSDPTGDGVARCVVPVPMTATTISIQLSQTNFAASAVHVSLAPADPSTHAARTRTCGGGFGFGTFTGRNAECARFYSCEPTTLLLDPATLGTPTAVNTSIYSHVVITADATLAAPSASCGPFALAAVVEFTETAVSQRPCDAGTEYRCEADGVCVSLERICDGTVFDCTDRADELVCAEYRLVDEAVAPTPSAGIGRSSEVVIARTGAVVADATVCKRQAIADGAPAFFVSSNSTAVSCLLYGAVPAAGLKTSPEAFFAAPSTATPVSGSVFLRGEGYAKCTSVLHCNSRGTIDAAASSITSSGIASCTCQCDRGYTGSDCSSEVRIGARQEYFAIAIRENAPGLLAASLALQAALADGRQPPAFSVTLGGTATPFSATEVLLPFTASSIDSTALKEYFDSVRGSEAVVDALTLRVNAALSAQGLPGIEGFFSGDGVNSVTRFGSCIATQSDGNCAVDVPAAFLTTTARRRRPSVTFAVSSVTTFALTWSLTTSTGRRQFSTADIGDSVFDITNSSVAAVSQSNSSACPSVRAVVSLPRVIATADGSMPALSAHLRPLTTVAAACTTGFAVVALGSVPTATLDSPTVVDAAAAASLFAGTGNSANVGFEMVLGPLTVRHWPLGVFIVLLGFVVIAIPVTMALVFTSRHLIEMTNERSQRRIESAAAVHRMAQPPSSADDAAAFDPAEQSTSLAGRSLSMPMPATTKHTRRRRQQRNGVDPDRLRYLERIGMSDMIEAIADGGDVLGDGPNGASASHDSPGLIPMNSMTDIGSLTLRAAQRLRSVHLSQPAPAAGGAGGGGGKPVAEASTWVLGLNEQDLVKGIRRATIGVVVAVLVLVMLVAADLAVSFWVVQRFSTATSQFRVMLRFYSSKRCDGDVFMWTVPVGATAIEGAGVCTTSAFGTGEARRFVDGAALCRDDGTVGIFLGTQCEALTGASDSFLGTFSQTSARGLLTRRLPTDQCLSADAIPGLDASSGAVPGAYVSLSCIRDEDAAAYVDHLDALSVDTGAGSGSVLPVDVAVEATAHAVSHNPLIWQRRKVTLGQTGFDTSHRFDRVASTATGDRLAGARDPRRIIVQDGDSFARQIYTDNSSASAAAASESLLGASRMATCFADSDPATGAQRLGLLPRGDLDCPIGNLVGFDGGVDNTADSAADRHFVGSGDALDFVDVGKRIRQLDYGSVLSAGARVSVTIRFWARFTPSTSGFAFALTDLYESAQVSPLLARLRAIALRERPAAEWLTGFNAYHALFVDGSRRTLTLIMARGREAHANHSVQDAEWAVDRLGAGRAFNGDWHSFAIVFARTARGRVVARLSVDAETSHQGNHLVCLASAPQEMHGPRVESVPVAAADPSQVLLGRNGVLYVGAFVGGIQGLTVDTDPANTADQLRLGTRAMRLFSRHRRMFGMLCAAAAFLVAVLPPLLLAAFFWVISPYRAYQRRQRALRPRKKRAALELQRASAVAVTSDANFTNNDSLVVFAPPVALQHNDCTAPAVGLEDTAVALPPPRGAEAPEQGHREVGADDVDDSVHAGFARSTAEVATVAARRWYLGSIRRLYGLDYAALRWGVFSAVARQRGVDLLCLVEELSAAPTTTYGIPKAVLLMRQWMQRDGSGGSGVPVRVVMPNEWRSMWSTDDVVPGTGAGREQVGGSSRADDEFNTTSATNAGTAPPAVSAAQGSGTTGSAMVLSSVIEMLSTLTTLSVYVHSMSFPRLFDVTIGISLTLLTRLFENLLQEQVYVAVVCIFTLLLLVVVSVQLGSSEAAFRNYVDTVVHKALAERAEREKTWHSDSAAVAARYSAFAIKATDNGFDDTHQGVQQGTLANLSRAGSHRMSQRECSGNRIANRFADAVLAAQAAIPDGDGAASATDLGDTTWGSESRCIPGVAEQRRTVGASFSIMRSKRVRPASEIVRLSQRLPGRQNAARGAAIRTDVPHPLILPLEEAAAVRVALSHSATEHSMQIQLRHPDLRESDGALLPGDPTDRDHLDQGGGALEDAVDLCGAHYRHAADSEPTASPDQFPAGSRGFALLSHVPKARFVSDGFAFVAVHRRTEDGLFGGRRHFLSEVRPRCPLHDVSLATMVADREAPGTELRRACCAFVLPPHYWNFSPSSDPSASTLPSTPPVALCGCDTAELLCCPECQFALCPSHVTLSILDRLSVAVATAFEAARAAGVLSIIAGAPLFVALVLHQGVVRMCLAVVACHPDVQCDFGGSGCPRLKRDLFWATSVSLFVLVVYGVLFPLGLSLLLVSRRRLLRERYFLRPSFSLRFTQRGVAAVDRWCTAHLRSEPLVAWDVATPHRRELLPYVPDADSLVAGDDPASHRARVQRRSALWRLINAATGGSSGHSPEGDHELFFDELSFSSFASPRGAGTPQHTNSPPLGSPRPHIASPKQRPDGTRARTAHPAATAVPDHVIDRQATPSVQAGDVVDAEAWTRFLAGDVSVLAPHYRSGSMEGMPYAVLPQCLRAVLVVAPTMMERDTVAQTLLSFGAELVVYAVTLKITDHTADWARALAAASCSLRISVLGLHALDSYLRAERTDWTEPIGVTMLALVAAYVVFVILLVASVAGGAAVRDVWNRLSIERAFAACGLETGVGQPVLAATDATAAVAMKKLRATAAERGKKRKPNASHTSHTCATPTATNNKPGTVTVVTD